MTLEEIQAITDRLSYKPGWSFEVYGGEWEGLHINIVAEALPNSYGGPPLDLGVHSSIPPVQTKGEFIRWLAWRLQRIEIHEMREFFKLDGEVIFDPHAPGANEDRSAWLFRETREEVPA